MFWAARSRIIPIAMKPRLAILSLSVMRLTMLGMMIKRVHQPSKKMSRLNSPRALPPKIMPRAMIAMPQIIGFSCFIIVLLWVYYNTHPIWGGVEVIKLFANMVIYVIISLLWTRKLSRESDLLSLILRIRKNIS